MMTTNLRMQIIEQLHELQWVFRTKQLRNHLDPNQIGEVEHHPDLKQIRVNLNKRHQYSTIKWTTLKEPIKQN